MSTVILLWWHLFGILETLFFVLFIHVVASFMSCRNYFKHHAKNYSLKIKDAKKARSFCVMRSEEHTSELQSRFDLVCRLLLEKKNIVSIRTQVHNIYDINTY